MLFNLAVLLSSRFHYLNLTNMADVTPKTVSVNYDQLSESLSQEEVDELAEFLESKAESEHCMTLEKADGFLCAIAVGPGPIPTSEWMPVLWGGDDGPVFESIEQAQRITQLLLRHWNAVLSGVRRNPGETMDFYVPLIAYPNDEVPENAMDTDLGKAWAEGFRIGTSLNDELWDECFKEEDDIYHCFAPIVLLEMGQNPDKPDMIIDFAKRQELVMMLPVVANEFYRYWREYEKREHQPLPMNQPYRATPKLGRNDPCPCGSGKRFKKCCGSGVSLH
ncbi:MAG TPA: UPF0149 family protein [Methylococcaceae bacterium]|nr:UPF0149 family protein [Methylococcaceae bacterium]